MKKRTRIAIVTSGLLVGALVTGAVAGTTGQAIASTIEAGHVDDYGTRVEVDGRQMNVVTTGQGEQTIVLLPGFGTAAPAIDFAPITRELSRDHRVIVVEPFGYGLSDQTDTPRTTENIVTEVHSALAAMGVDEYVLGGHSIAGLYALDYVARYRDEVTAYVGIDTSVPEQPGMDTDIPVDAFALLRALGITRMLTSVSPTDPGAAYTAAEAAQMALLSNRNSLAPTYLDEMSRIGDNFARAQGATFPEDLPLLLLVEADNAANPDWVALHERQAAEVADSTVIPIDGEHYLHHTHADEIVREIESFLG